MAQTELGERGAQVGLIAERAEPDSRAERVAGKLRAGGFGSRLAVMGMRLTAILLNFLVQVVMARVMGLAAFGSTNTALAVLNILVVPAALGYDTAAIRYVALAVGDRPRLRALSVAFARLVAVGCAVTAILVGAAALVESALGRGGIAIGLATLILITPGFALVRVAEAWMRGVGSVIRAQVNSGVIIPGLSIVFLLAQKSFVKPGHSIGVLGAMGARGLATAIAVVTVGRFVYKRLGGRLRPRDELDSDALSEIRKVAVVLCGVAFLTMLVGQIDIVAVSLLQGPSAAGIYSAASRIALAMNVCIVAVAFVLAPHVARLFAEGKTRELQNEVSSAALWSGALMAALCAILIPASPLVLQVFGSRFEAGAGALRILLVGQLANGICGPVAVTLNMTGHQKLAIRALTFAAFVDVILLATLIPALGIQGAACATAACTVIWNVAMLIYVRRDLGIWVLPRFAERLLP